MEKLTHWKKEINSNYLGSWDLCIGANEFGKPVYKELNLTIKNVEKKPVADMEQIKKGKANATKDEVLVSFNEVDKPMIIHAKTNFKALEKATGTPFVEYWIGKEICVYVEIGVKAFGTVTDALRIKQCVKRICSVCGKVISEDLYQMSVKKYGKAYCSKECKDRI